MIDIHIANDNEWMICREHTIQNATREKSRDYSQYRCVCASLDGVMVAYTFYLVIPPNIGEIHRIWALGDHRWALRDCISLALTDMKLRGVVEMSTYVHCDNNDEQEFFENLGFNCRWYKMLYYSKDSDPAIRAFGELGHSKID